MNKREPLWNHELGNTGDADHHWLTINKYPNLYHLSYLEWQAWFWKNEPKGDLSYFKDIVYSVLLLVLSECRDWIKVAPITTARHLSVTSQVSKRTNISFWGCAFSNTMPLLGQLFLVVWICRTFDRKWELQSGKGKKK